MLHSKNSLFAKSSETKADKYTYARYLREQEGLILHFLSPVVQGKSETDSDWTGRIQALVKSIKKALAETNKYNARVQKDIQSDVAELKRQMDGLTHETRETRARLTRMETMLEKVTRHLDAPRQTAPSVAESSAATTSS